MLTRSDLGKAQFTIMHDVELDEYDRLRRPYAMTRCRCCTLCLTATVCSAWFLILAGIASGGWTFSQFGQDAFVRALLNGTRGGLFIEVGASDGITNSNSYLFEAFHGYRGICVEPGPRQGLLSWLRPRCFLSTSPVSNKDDRAVSFVVGSRTAEHSRMQESEPAAGAAALTDSSGRRGGSAFATRTVTLTRLVKQLQTARGWDVNKSLTFCFVSIDTEGFEVEALEGFPFERHSIRVLLVEDSGRGIGPRATRLLHRVSKLTHVGTLAADVIFTEHRLAARARKMLNADKDSPLGEWKKAKGLYVTFEHYGRIALEKTIGIHLRRV